MPANGQNLDFSDEVYSSDDPDVRAIASMWESCFRAAVHPGEEGRPETYWGDEKTDIVKNAFTANYPIYSFGFHRTFNIRPTEGGFFEIHTLNEWPGPEQGIEVNAIYTICAKRVDDEFRLFNYFSFSKRALDSYTNRYIEYYYPCSYAFDRAKADSTIRFIEWFTATYDLPADTPVRYVVANTLDECNAILGFPYSWLRSHLSYAGAFLYPETIISRRPDHLHELVHFFVKQKFPRATDLLHEGIAAYYGGSSDRSYAEHLRMFREYLEAHPDVDLSGFDSYRVLVDGVTNPFYTVGALLVDRALAIGGPEQVLRLFAYTDPGKMFESGLSVPRGEIDAYLRKLIADK